MFFILGDEVLHVSPFSKPFGTRQMLIVDST